MNTKGILNLLMIGVLIISGCKKKEEADLNPNLRTVIGVCEVLSTSNSTKVRVYSIHLNEGSTNVSGTESEAGDGSTFNLNGSGVEYSYHISEWGLGTPQTTVSKDYTGKLNDKAFIKNQKNIINIVRDGAEWKLLLNGKDEEAAVAGSVSGSTSPSGVWQRYGSPGGYQTDLAIGNIPGQAANRVYMCEHPGSPSAGLYKGYISGNIITWDAVYGLPNAEFNILNSGPDRTLYFGVGNLSDAGKYKKGTWTNTCPM